MTETSFDLFQKSLATFGYFNLEIFRQLWRYIEFSENVQKLVHLAFLQTYFEKSSGIFRK